MSQIKLRWKYAEGDYDTKTMRLTVIPGRGPEPWRYEN